MKKHLMLTSIYCLASLISISQSKNTSKDFNKDGITDRVTISEDGGSAFSSTSADYTDGKTKKKYEFSVQYSFGSFFAA